MHEEISMTGGGQADSGMAICREDDLDKQVSIERLQTAFDAIFGNDGEEPLKKQILMARLKESELEEALKELAAVTAIPQP